MFYRRKVILALIEILGGDIEKLRLQKLLFLYTKKKADPEYEFIPYKFGCYSYSVKADLNTMVKRGFLTENEKSYEKADNISYLKQLHSNDREYLQETINDYGRMSTTSLITHTYINFPFYAINSTIAKEQLPAKYYNRIEKVKPQGTKKILFTIGYEGISLEGYLQKLIKNDVKVLVDVRRNPRSMKFGFSKTLLTKYCNSLGIEYIHFPEVGIASDKRRELNNQEDYDILFEEYTNTTLKSTGNSQNNILSLLHKHKRIALTCFEAEPCQCHRSHLADSISKIPDFAYPIIHL